MSNKVTIKGKPVTGRLIDQVKENQRIHFESFAKPLPFDGAPSADYYKNQIVDVAIDVPSRINRDTDVSNIVRVLKETGGFDIRLWNPPTIAELPGGQRLLYDGDHSRAIYRSFFPKAKTMPGRIVPINQLPEYHMLFIRANARCKTSIKAEEVFVHEYHAKDPTAVRLATELNGAGLQIYCSHECDGQVGDPLGMRVKIGAAKTAFKTHQRTMKARITPSRGYKTAVRDAVSVLKMAGLSTTAEESLPAELLEGIVMIFGCHEGLRPGGLDHTIVSKWLNVKLQSSSVKQVAAELKSSGGALVNFSGWSVAKGILIQLANKSDVPVLRTMQGKYTHTTLNRIHGPKKK
tara:strand:- start:3472 stop:4518 length:1047 start_codon:yes stop_codon:yes gene_type:complete